MDYKNSKITTVISPITDPLPITATSGFFLIFFKNDVLESMKLNTGYFEILSISKFDMAILFGVLRIKNKNQIIISSPTFRVKRGINGQKRKFYSSDKKRYRRFFKYFFCKFQWKGIKLLQSIEVSRKKCVFVNKFVLAEKGNNFYRMNLFSPCMAIISHC